MSFKNLTDQDELILMIALLPLKNKPSVKSSLIPMNTAFVNNYSNETITSTLNSQAEMNLAKRFLERS